MRVQTRWSQRLRLHAHALILGHIHNKDKRIKELIMTQN